MGLQQVARRTCCLVAGEPPVWGGRQGRHLRPHQGCPSRHHLGGPAGELTLGPPRPHQGCPAAWVDGRLVVEEGSRVGVLSPRGSKLGSPAMGPARAPARGRVGGQWPDLLFFSLQQERNAGCLNDKWALMTSGAKQVVSMTSGPCMVLSHSGHEFIVELCFFF